MQVAWGASPNPTNWTTCTASMNQTITAPDGVKTVYMKFKDAFDNTSTELSDTIILDTVDPTSDIAPNGSPCFTGDKMVTITCDDSAGA